MEKKKVSGMTIQETCEYVREQIVLHRISPGTRLTEQSLCDELGIGRSTARNALQQLAQSGLVEHAPNIGARVTVFTRQQVEALLSVKNDLVMYALDRTINQYYEMDFVNLYKIVSKEKEGIKNHDFLHYLEGIADFYNYFVDKVGNPYLSKAFHDMSNTYNVYQLLYDVFYELNDNEFALDKIHPRIIEAVRSKNIEAVRTQLNNMRVFLLSYYDYGARQTVDTYNFPSIFF